MQQPMTWSGAMQSEDYMSFLVRMWRAHRGAEQLCEWRGEIELIQTGVRWRFGSHGELLRFLQQLAATPVLEAPFEE
jgi:hypothetical protein